LKKCEFFTNNFVFLSFVVSSEWVKMNPIKIEAILS
jgi:hypothetical protein